MLPYTWEYKEPLSLNTQTQEDGGQNYYRNKAIIIIIICITIYIV